MSLTQVVDTDPTCGCPIAPVELDRAGRRRLRKAIEAGAVAGPASHLDTCHLVVAERKAALVADEGRLPPPHEPWGRRLSA